MPSGEELESEQPAPPPQFWKSEGQVTCVICGMPKPLDGEAVWLHETYHTEKEERP